MKKTENVCTWPVFVTDEGDRVIFPGYFSDLNEPRTVTAERTLQLAQISGWEVEMYSFSCVIDEGVARFTRLTVEIEEAPEAFRNAWVIGGPHWEEHCG